MFVIWMIILFLRPMSEAIADLETGLRAYAFGDYETALPEFHVAAEQGNAEAQSFLGDMYRKGEGTPQN